jgi:quinol monooxygenase YgiN
VSRTGSFFLFDFGQLFVGAQVRIGIASASGAIRTGWINQSQLLCSSQLNQLVAVEHHLVEYLGRFARIAVIPRRVCVAGIECPAPKDDPVEQIQATATFPKIAPGGLAVFKRLAARALELTKGEAGNLQYDWFFSGDETKCVVREAYENSDAVLAHVANMGELIGKEAALGRGLEIEAFGPVSPQLAEALAALQPTVYGFFQGK